MAYHLKDIRKGVLGEVSKIEEEFEEFVDAWEQGSVVMQLVELSDLLGAIESYVARWQIGLKDLRFFSDITKRAFESGNRE